MVGAYANPGTPLSNDLLTVHENLDFPKILGRLQACWVIAKGLAPVGPQAHDDVLARYWSVRIRKYAAWFLLSALANAADSALRFLFHKSFSLNDERAIEF